MEEAAAQFLGRDSILPEEPVVPDAPETNAAPEAPPVEKAVEPPQYDFIKEFNSRTGLSIDSEEGLKRIVDIYSKAPEIEEKAKVIPELVDALEKLQNPLNYFKDEAAYKVSQLAKEPKYAGKEAYIDKVLRNDLAQLDDLKVIELAANLRAKDGVRNPLRAELRSMGIDPDAALEGYDELDDDTKDLLTMRAAQYREDLPKIADDVKVPSFEGTAVERLISQKKSQQEDYANRLVNIMPVATNIISEIKELKVTDDFSFKLEMSQDDLKDYSESLAEILASGKYDIGTQEGKAEVYGAIMDMLKADYYDKAVSAYASFMRTKVEEDMRRKFGNEKPLDKKEPPLDRREEEKGLIEKAAESLISQVW